MPGAPSSCAHVQHGHCMTSEVALAVPLATNELTNFSGDPTPLLCAISSEDYNVVGGDPTPLLCTISSEDYNVVGGDPTPLLRTISSEYLRCCWWGSHTTAVYHLQ